MKQNPFAKSDAERVEMTVSCKDAEDIDRVPNAGKVISKDGKKYQVMHNGLLVVADGYYGSWMTDLIKKLRGCHEPQEEKVFDAVIKRIKSSKAKSHNMIELGSFWSFYSLWFAKSLKNTKVYCIEPDQNNLKIGKENFRLNNLAECATFYRAASGYGHGEKYPFLSENSKEPEMLPVVAADWIVDEYKIPHVDILHLDIQGYELHALAASEKPIRAGKIRFLFVSTHHYAFSKDPMTHQRCLKWIKDVGGTIIAEHNVLESYSGDGLIVASFDDRDKNFKVSISRNTSADSLFRSYEQDLATLIKEIDG
jgi:FkbM family methyltransferase